MDEIKTSAEPEIIDGDGIARKAHYGNGRQPWDDIVDMGWGQQFAAGNVLKYIRRAAKKNGPDDISKARWYYARLLEIGDLDVLNKIFDLLTKDERAEVAFVKEGDGFK